jgi:hypothetical protein
MKVKLYTRGDGFVTEGELPPYNEPPEVLFWGERVFVRDPWRVDNSDEWVRYTEAWSTALVAEVSV